MAFISNAAHQKFITQCQRIISPTVENNELFIFDDKENKLIKELAELQQLMDAYQNILLELPRLTCKYYNLHNRIRIDIRKVQLKKIKIIRKNQH